MWRYCGEDENFQSRGFDDDDAIRHSLHGAAHTTGIIEKSAKKEKMIYMCGLCRSKDKKNKENTKQPRVQNGREEEAGKFRRCPRRRRRMHVKSEEGETTDMILLIVSSSRRISPEISQVIFFGNLKATVFEGRTYIQRHHSGRLWCCVQHQLQCIASLRTIF